MKHKLIYAVLMLVMAAPAAAEPLRLAQAAPGALPPYEVLTIIRSTGLQPIGQPVRRGDNYVLRAIDPGRQEVRVVVDAWDGSILDVRPLMATRTARPMPADDEYYERLSPPGAIYLPPEAPRGFYRGGPPVYADEPPSIYSPRQTPSGPPGPPRYSSTPGTGPAPQTSFGARPLSEPMVIPAPDGNDGGLLPPPPERFPQRAAPGPEPKAKPAPKPRTASNVPAGPPLPKPRPARPTPPVTAGEAPPEASAPAAAPKPKSDDVPH